MELRDLIHFGMRFMVEDPDKTLTLPPSYALL